MKFANAAIFAASTVSAASIKRQSDFFYTVNDFTASCIPHSVLCNYNFTVEASAASNSPTECTLTLMGPDYLPEVPLQGCSGGPGYSWSVTKPADGGLSLTITTVVSAGVTNQTGTYLIPASNLTLTQNGATTSQSYIGPKQFWVSSEVVSV